MLTQPDLAMRLSDEVCTYEYTYVVKLTSVRLAYEGSHLLIVALICNICHTTVMAFSVELSSFCCETFAVIALQQYDFRICCETLQLLL